MATYCFGDLHGRYDIWQQIKEFIKPEDTVYCLGDCADRGADGYKIICEVLTHPNITYIKGNHEDLLVRAYKYGETSLWFCNGGYTTNDAIKNSLDGDGIKALYNTLNKLPYKKYIKTKKGKVVLSHAGCNPWNVRYLSEKDYIWDRNHIYSEWTEDEEYKDVYVVHGHTPTLLEDWEWVVGPDNIPKNNNPFIIEYADGHKVCIDTGAVWTGVAVLFDLDTFNPIYFRGESKKC